MNSKGNSAILIQVDLLKAIAELQEEKRRIEQAIGTLQQVLTARAGSVESSAPKKRGRKFMTSEERAVVRERMKKYWETRRAERAKSA